MFFLLLFKWCWTASLLADGTVGCVFLAMNVLEVKFIGDDDVLEHIVDKREGMDLSRSSASAFVFSESLTVAVCIQNKDVQSNSGAVQKMVKLKIPPARRVKEQDIEQEGDENGFMSEQTYIQALGADMEGERKHCLNAPLLMPSDFDYCSTFAVFEKKLKLCVFLKMPFSSACSNWATEEDDGMSRVAGSSIFTFQKVKRGHSMAQTGESPPFISPSQT